MLYSKQSINILEDMYSTSIDIFYGVLSICLLVFTGFLVWAIFYVVQILKQGNEVIADLRVKIAEIEEAIMAVKDRVITSANTLSFIAGEIGNVMDIVKSVKKTTSRGGRRRKE